MLLSPSRTHNQFVIVPPSRATIPAVFRNATTDSRCHEDLLAGMQRFRGRIYAADGAIQPAELTADGRHKAPIDEQSWHILSLDRNGQICACIRYFEETRAGGFDDLWVRHAAMARSAHAAQFRDAVEGEMRRARQMRIGFGEAGGWAVAEQCRSTAEPLRVALAIFALMELLGGSAGVATATFRHHSSTILRRIGLAPLNAGGADLPPYYDSRYRCDMEVLRFDSRFPDPKYAPAVRQLRSTLAAAPVFGRDNVRTVLKGVLRGFDMAATDPASLADLVPAT